MPAPDDPSAPSTLLLPPHLRLPDLTHVRTFTAADVASWRDTAQQAVAWGPDQRNGCRRATVEGDTVWYDDRGRPHSPDEYTPARVSDTGSIEWDQHGELHASPARPAWMPRLRGNITWYDHGDLHRAHAPAVIESGGWHDWWWQGVNALHALQELLTAAWTHQGPHDRDANDLLAQAERLDPDPALPITATAWTAHVLLASPLAFLSPATRSWLTLLTT